MHRLVVIGVALAALMGMPALVGQATTARADEPQRIVETVVEGRLLEKKEKLLRFLGLQPGALWRGVQTEEQVNADLDKLGYRTRGFQGEQAADGYHVHLSVEPMRVVRHVLVSGAWPYFEDEILRHLTLRSGLPLPPDDELAARLVEEAAHVRQFLERDGYFASTVTITPHHPYRLPFTHPPEEWIDLKVAVTLGKWYPVGLVHGEGNHAISNDELYEIFHHRLFRWGRFSTQQMRDDAQKAEKTLRERGYPAARVVPQFDAVRDIDVKNEQVVLPVKVIEKKRVAVKLLGNRLISDSQLNDELTIYQTGAYDDVELAESAHAIARLYQQRGYFEVEVNFTRRREGDSMEEVTFYIEEGPELRVRRVEVVSESGAPLQFPEEQIREGAALETKPFPAFGAIGLGEGGYATTVQLAQDVDRLVDYYKSLGFPQVKARAEVTRDPNSFGSAGLLGAEVAAEVGKKDLYVRFFVDEGRRELVDHIEVDLQRGPPPPAEASARLARVKSPTRAQILGALKMTNGTPYTDARFREDQNRILQLYRGSGRPYVQIGYAGSSWNTAHDRFIVRYRVDEGPLVTFGEILVRGNFVTRERVIRADLPFRPGDPFDLNKLAEGERNLQTHQIFNTARVSPVRLSEHPNPVPILVTVTERYLERAGSFVVGVGVATDRLPYYWYATVAWQWNNVLGFGSQLELKGDFDWINSMGAQLRYTDLRAFGPGWRFDLTFFGRTEETYRLGQITSYGGSIGLTRILTPALRVFQRLDLYQANIGVGFTRLEGPNDTSTIPDDTRILKLVWGVVWDRRTGLDGLPNPLMPAKGWMLSATLGYSPPRILSNHHFVEVSGQAMALAPLHARNGDFTFIANLRYDEGFPINESVLPAVERFFAGGDTSTRGYETDQLKTEIVRSAVPPLGGDPGFRIIPQGGNIRVLSTLEMQFPIARTFLGLQWPWVGAVFYDVGAVLDNWSQVQVSDFKHAVGVTFLRVLTTFGPLSLEYAYPLNQSLAEERWKTNPWYSHFPGRIHLNWGIPLSRL